mmetsp:Transcript_44758/g.97235  ORF Transcript_44758/g.97235 Transcript_44758/m.97235 type:complete len:219 (+) Transcript_44758:431-1087(+)
MLAVSLKPEVRAATEGGIREQVRSDGPAVTVHRRVHRRDLGKSACCQSCHRLSVIVHRLHEFPVLLHAHVAVVVEIDEEGRLICVGPGQEGYGMATAILEDLHGIGWHVNAINDWKPIGRRACERSNGLLCRGRYDLRGVLAPHAGYPRGAVRAAERHGEALCVLAGRIPGARSREARLADGGPEEAAAQGRGHVVKDGHGAGRLPKDRHLLRVAAES